MSVDKSTISPSIGTGAAIKPVQAGASVSSQKSGLADSMVSGAPGISPFNTPMFSDADGSVVSGIAQFAGRVINAIQNAQTTGTNPYATNTTTNDWINQAMVNNAIANEMQGANENEGTKSITKTKETEHDSEAIEALAGVDIRHVNGSAGPGDKPAGGDGSGETSEDAIHETLGSKINADMAAKLDGLVMVFADKVEGAAGWFSSDMAITLHKNGSMDTMFHEVGHALQHKLGGGLGNPRNGAQGGWGDEKMNTHMDTIRSIMTDPENNFNVAGLDGHYGWNNSNKGGAHDQSEEYAEAFSMWATKRDKFEEAFGKEIADDFDEFFGKESENYDSNETTQENDPTTIPLFPFYNPLALRLMFGIGPQIQMQPGLIPQFVPPAAQAQQQPNRVNL